MMYDMNQESEFVIAMSERQISAREFFSTVLLDSLEKDFKLQSAAIFIYDTEGKFLSCIKKSGTEIAGQDDPYTKILPYNKFQQIIYHEAVEDNMTYFNLEPRIYRISDYYKDENYDESHYANYLEENFDAHYALVLAFGINAYIQIAFFKSYEEGDFTEQEMERFESIYRYIAISYKGFKKHEHSKIISNIQDEIISSGERAYLITDDFMHILSYNKAAVELLTSVLGNTVADQMDGNTPCLWLPFLLEGKKDQIGEDRVVIKEIKDCIFKIYTYDQSYSHGIVDRYHWITISKKELNEELTKPPANYQLTAAESKVADLLCDGLTYQKIADELMVSYHTVKNHVQNIFVKCKVKNRYELFNLLTKMKNRE